MLILAKALIVVTLGGKELLEMRLAIENTLHGSVVSKGECTFAVRALQTTLVESLLVFFVFHHYFLSDIHCLVAHCTLFCSSSKLRHCRCWLRLKKMIIRGGVQISQCSPLVGRGASRSKKA
jgi:hypothetical protein